MRRRDRIAAVAVLLTCVASALAIGGATRWTALFAAALGLCCGAVYLPSRRQLRHVPWLLWLIAAAAAATALQLVPLPLALLGEKGELLAANAAALGRSHIRTEQIGELIRWHVDAPALAPLSYDPPATWFELAKLAGYLGFAACVIRLAGSRRGRRAVAVAIAAAAAAVAVVTVIHVAAGAHQLYGFYQPRHARHPVLMAPFLNPNHLAGCLAAGTPVAAALAVATPAPRRLAWAAAAALCGVVALVAGSRMGVLSLLLGLGVLAALVVPGARRRAADRSTRVAAAITLAVAAGAALWYFGSSAIEEIVGTGSDELLGHRGKLAVWRAAVPLIGHHPVFGVGRGGFEPAFSGHVEGALAYSHIENEYLQALVDWGLLPAAVFAVLLWLAVRSAARRAPGTVIEAGLAASLAAAAFHNLADFGLELPGVAYLALAAFAGLSRTPLEPVEPRHRHRRLAALAAGAAILAVAASPLATPARAETDALVSWAQGRPPAAALDRASAIWRRHPRDFVAAAQVAEALFAAGDPRAVQVINRALTMKPDDGGLHWLAARMLVRSQKPAQALIEYRLAIAHGTAGPILDELVARFPEPERAVRGLPLEPRRAVQLFPLLRGRHLTHLGHLYASAVAQRAPSDGRLQRERALFAFGDKDLEEAIEAGRAAVAAKDDRGVVPLALALLASSRFAEAAAAIEEVRAAGRPRERHEILRELDLLAKARERQGHPEAALEALSQAVEVTGQSPEAVPFLQKMAAILDALHMPHRAKLMRQKAAELRRPR